MLQKAETVIFYWIDNILMWARLTGTDLMSAVHGPNELST